MSRGINPSSYDHLISIESDGDRTGRLGPSPSISSRPAPGTPVTAATLPTTHAVTSPEPQLEFQNFILPQTSLSGGAPLQSGANSSPFVKNSLNYPQDYASSPSQPVVVSDSLYTPQQQPPGSSGPVWSISYYSQFFNVDTTDVVQRMLHSLLPREDFNVVLDNNADLYGPFWISTTVIFALFITSSMAESIRNFQNSGEAYKYNVDLLSFATATVYTYASCLPLAVWGIGKYYKAPVVLMEIVDIYGYSLTIWIPVAILCAFPLGIFRWVVVIFAFALSTYFITKNIMPVIRQSERSMQARTFVWGLIVAAQVALTLLFKFGFSVFSF